jgi:hypothetical protein
MWATRAGYGWKRIITVAGRTARAPGSVRRHLGRQCRQCRQQRLDEIQRQREHDSGGFAVVAQIRHGLQVAQLQCLRLLGEQRGGIAQLFGRLVFAFGVDHLGTAFTLGLGLPGDRAHHGLVEVHVLDLDVHDLDAPRVGGFIQRHLQRVVDRIALGENFVQFMLAQYRAQARLRQLAGRLEKLRHFQHGFLRIHHAEIHHRIDPHRHVVQRNDILRRHVHHRDPQVHADHALHGRQQQHQAGSLGPGIPAQGKDHAAFVLGQDLDRREQQHDADDHQYTDESNHDTLP